MLKNFITSSKPLSESNTYVETSIETKFGSFILRVYKDLPNKETIVFYTKNIDSLECPLVRVHSECMTGDMFGSLKCDCGDQLHEALNLIQKEGGALVYLRQEGRGIGLYEKIKAYALQLEGYDTFEANTALGHKPDARTYEMAKIALDDLEISKIALLTNNPSKVAEISKYGIEIVEQIPLKIEPCKFNQKYFKTKEKKFKHNFSGKAHSYFYQFHVDTAEEFSQYLKEEIKPNNPLLKICVGINTNSEDAIHLPSEFKRIEQIYSTSKCSLTLPILHISFASCKNPRVSLEKIKQKYPFVKRVQLNDIENLNFEILKFAYKNFIVDLPLSNENFSILNFEDIRTIIIENDGLILLDNSKGKGVTESIAAYKEKIDILSEFSFNHIGLCGGFGPNELNTYLELCKFYKCNFSIDAESKLRKDDKYCPSKIQAYLIQLVTGSQDKCPGIEQTKQLLKENARTNWDSFFYNNHKYLVHPQVFHAGRFPSPKWYAEIISKLVQDEENFCEVGCGCGIVTCEVAINNPLLQLFATDLNPHASQNTALNSLNLEINNRVTTTCGDVLDGIEPNNQFDSIFWLMPFGNTNSSNTLEEIQVFDPEYRAISKFFETAKQYIKEHGRLLIGFSETIGDFDLLKKYAHQFNWELSIINKTLLKEKDLIDFVLIEARISK